MDSVSNIRFNLNSTTNFTFNSSFLLLPDNVLEDAYEIFFKFAFGSAIYMFIASFLSIIANGLLLLVFLFDPLKIFRKATTYFLVGLSIADILTATTQQPMFATCFTMIYIKHRDTGKTCQTLISVGHHISLVAMNCSFIIVLSFTIAQFIVVISPLKYAQKVTKCRVIVCIIGIYAYAILLTLLPKMGVHRDSLLKFDTIFHSIILTYLIIIFYVLLFITFKKKAAASRSLQEDQRTEGRGRRTCLERKFIVVNFFLVAILFLCSQPVTILGMVSLYSSEDPNSPEFLIASLIVENVLYLKFLLDLFLYAWRIPKYRQALKIILRWSHSKNKKPCRGSMFSDCAIAELSLSRDTVITLDFKAISQ